jgi:hypothetical protein
MACGTLSHSPANKRVSGEFSRVKAVGAQSTPHSSLKMLTILLPLSLYFLAHCSGSQLCHSTHRVRKAAFNFQKQPEYEINYFGQSER